MAKIKIVVTAQGVKIKAEGYQGPACEKAVRFFADRLAGEQTNSENTPEFYQQPDQEVQQ